MNNTEEVVVDENAEVSATEVNAEETTGTDATDADVAAEETTEEAGE
ncbi:hypothetical protein KBC03_02270 [Patescibacteria group bacterium]|nr:hypothetical protein [Patescibacteria group bacterium]